MMPIRTPPFVYAPVWPIVSNTQGGPVHDAAQRILRPDGTPIAGLYAAGEIGSLFGHLYMACVGSSGENGFHLSPYRASSFWFMGHPCLS